MTAVSASSLSRPLSHLRPSSSPSPASTPLQFQCPFKFQTQFRIPPISCNFELREHWKLGPAKVRAVAEEEGTLVPEDEASPPPPGTADQIVSVPVSPSDVLTMYFQAEGTMTDTAVPAVTKALEGVEGISDLKVQVLEGIATVQLTKQTTVQATGVASNLVEMIQSSGFKLQTLNLSFEDEEDIV